MSKPKFEIGDKITVTEDLQKLVTKHKWPSGMLKHINTSGIVIGISPDLWRVGGEYNKEVYYDLSFDGIEAPLYFPESALKSAE